MIKKRPMNFSESDTISYLIRHGDRDEIPKGSFGNDVLLNKEGIKNAIKFGENIEHLNLTKIITSPVGRCFQTAEYITKGFGKQVEIEESTALGSPGLHIKDEKIAGEFYLKHGFDKIYKNFKAGNEIPGFARIDDLYNGLTEYLIKNSSSTGLTIFITHDMLIAFYHYCINETVYTKENWVEFLSGIVLKNGKYER